MTATFIVDGDNVTIRFEKTSTVIMATAIIGLVAEELAERQDIDFEALTPQQKLDLVDTHLWPYMLRMARQRNEENKVELAREDAQDDGINF